VVDSKGEDSCKWVERLRLRLGSGDLSSELLLNVTAPCATVYGKAVAIEWDLKAIGSLRGTSKYKSWVEASVQLGG
jgi:hypothetical protein